jgi:hypothetical protein
MDPLRPVNANADRNVVLGNPPGPFVCDQRAVGLNSLTDIKAGGFVLVDQLCRGAIKVKTRQ